MPDKENSPYLACRTRTFSLSGMPDKENSPYLACQIRRILLIRQARQGEFSLSGTPESVMPDQENSPHLACQIRRILLIWQIGILPIWHKENSPYLARRIKERVASGMPNKRNYRIRYAGLGPLRSSSLACFGRRLGEPCAFQREGCGTNFRGIGDIFWQGVVKHQGFSTQPEPVLGTPKQATSYTPTCGRETLGLPQD